jgi:hypothetical protein
MRKSVWVWSALVVVGVACGGSDESTIDQPGGGGNSGDASVGGTGAAGPGVICTATGKACTDGATCCSKTCDPTSKTCASTVGHCLASGGLCAIPTDCCNLSCVNGACGATACISDGQACTASSACCSANCVNGSCQPLNSSCKTAGNACGSNTDCCSKLCASGTCQLASSFCIQLGDACAVGADCCGGTCDIAAGASLGTCGQPPTGSSFCHGGFDGVVCNQCNECCSRLCEPGPAGVKICQRASGCHIDGDLCRKDTDCCGGPNTGLPGAGNVVCQKESGQEIGICRNPTGCNPHSNVCHYKDYPCDISSARNDCCGAPGNSGACQLDTLGVPRCYLLDACVQAGEICGSAFYCCDHLPRVPDANGVLRCAAHNPDGGTTCIPIGGSCTINADCCPGSQCIIPIGSTQGACGQPTPALDGGTAGSAGSGGTGAGGGATGGQGGGGVPANPACSLYGQACSSDADCCNAVPCTTPSLGSCAGATGCTCFYAVK